MLKVKFEVASRLSNSPKTLRAALWSGSSRLGVSEPCAGISGDNNALLGVPDFIHDPVISNSRSIEFVIQLLGTRAARVFVDLAEFVDDPLPRRR